MSITLFQINLGGEGEIPGILNQQPLEATDPQWRSLSGLVLPDLIRVVGPVLVCPNAKIELPDGCVDMVHTNNVPVDAVSTLGPGVQSSEIRRILKSGGVWLRDGVPYYTKP